MEFNRYQTPVEQLKYKHVDQESGEVQEFEWDTCPEEIREEFNEHISTIPFIQHLVGKDRPLCKDLPRDDKGRAIWKITEPPIIEDTDYFRPTAIHYQQTGKLTSLRPNPNPNSPYYKWAQEEKRRIIEGYLRESDGAWIPGDMYWFLNYSPIILTRIEDGEDNVGDRITDMPDFWEGILWRLIGWYDARRVGQNFAEIAKRGASKAHPYYQEVITPEGRKLWGDIKIGDWLFGDDGNPTQVVDIPFDDVADIYKITLKDGREVFASDEHLWRVKVHCHKNEEIWSTTKLLQEYKRQRKVTERNPSGIELVCGIPANKAVEFSEIPTKVDPYTFGFLLGDGCFRHSCCYFTSEDKDFETVKTKIPYEIIKWKAKFAYRLRIPNWRKILQEYGLWFKKSEDKFIPDEFKFNSKKVRLALLTGLMDADGRLGKHEVYQITTASAQLAKDVRELCFSLGYNTTYTKNRAGYKKDGIYKECLPVYIVSIFTRDRIVTIPRRIGKTNWSCNYAQSRAVQTRIANIEYVGKQKAKCVTVNNKSHCYLIGNYVVTHNSFVMASKLNKTFILGEKLRTPEEIKAKKPQNAKAVIMAYQKEFLIKDGTLNKFEQMFDFCKTHTEFPRKTLQNSLGEMSWEMGYIDLESGAKLGTRNTVFGIAIKDDTDKSRGKRASFIGIEEFGKFPNLSDVYKTTMSSVKEGNVWFGMIALIGTGGEEGSDFSSALDMIYHPAGFHLRAYENVWDKSAQSRGYSIFFFPAYVNRLGCYNKDGISDVTKALFAICCERYIAKYQNPDPMQITRTKAEDPVTIQDAIMRRDGTKFPVAQIAERIQEIDLDPKFYDKILHGRLYMRGNGEVFFEPTEDKPIHIFPTKDNKIHGAFEIKELPKKQPNGKVFPNRYIGALDPVDDDNSTTMSLVSLHILDTWNDEVVCEWTGRYDTADECFEQARLACIFYNAKLLYENNKKGCHAYFKQHNSLYLLAETPEFIKDREDSRIRKVGNKLYGVDARTPILNYGRDLLKDWMLKPVQRMIKHEDGTEEEITIPNVMTWWQRALLEEARQWNPDGNFDRISAMIILMLYRQQVIVDFGGIPDESSFKKNHTDSKALDPFFERAYPSSPQPQVQFNPINPHEFDY